MKYIQGLLRILKTEPALIGQTLTLGVAMLTAFGLHLSADRTGAVIVIVTALVALATALAARPVQVPVLAGIATTVLTACAAFGLDWSPAKIGSLVAFVSVFMGLLLRQHLTPVAAKDAG
jgi:hypothetical protein